MGKPQFGMAKNALFVNLTCVQRRCNAIFQRENNCCTAWSYAHGHSTPVRCTSPRQVAATIFG